MKNINQLRIGLLWGFIHMAILQAEAGTLPEEKQASPGVSGYWQAEPLITGVVIDENGEALAGVSVYIKKTNQGTITDENGKFSISALPGDILTFSYVGFKKKEVKVGNQQIIDITLYMDQYLLEGVVVTGYQTLSRERATGSFDKIDSKILNTRISSDISSVLQGLIPGMKATEKLDGSVDFVIRGTSTLHADQAPLIVVDGFPIQGSFNSINPNDIESVTILKDAAAASVWGARSANGVIVITTKKGSESKLKINVQAFYTFAVKPDIDHALAQADSRTQVDYELAALENRWFINPYTPSFGNISGGLTLAQEFYFANKYFGLSEEEMNAGLEKLRNTNNRKQIEDYLLQRQTVQQYNVSIEGGNDRSINYLSLMYEKKEENTIKRGYNRYFANFANTYTLTPWLTTHVSVNFQKKDTERGNQGLGDLSGLAPYELLLNEDGTYAPNTSAYNRFEQAKLPLDKFPYSDWSNNLLQNTRGRTNETKELRYKIQGGLNFKLADGLTYDARIQYESSTFDITNSDDESTYYVRNMVNSKTEYDPVSQTVGISRVPKGGIKRMSKEKLHNYVFRNQINFNRSFSDIHDISVIGGIEMSEYTSTQTRYPYVYGYNKTTEMTAVPPYGYGGGLDPFKNFMGIPTSVEGGSTSFSTRIDRYLSYYGNAGYTYKGKYDASFSIRADGSNFVSDNPLLRWSPMWSFGGKWNAKQENFLKDVSWLNRLSVRLTYGINGNAEKSTSPLPLISMRRTISSTTNMPEAILVNMGNPKLRWEKTYTANVGADFDMLNFLSGKIDFYNRRSKNVIGNTTIASANGTTSQKINNAEIVNRGVELQLAANINISSIGLGISPTVSYSYNKNKITKLYNHTLYAFQLVDPATYVEGRPVGSIYSYRYAGTENGIPYVYGINGNKNSMNDPFLHNRSSESSVLIYSGTTVPPHTLGWNTKFTYKGFSLHALILGNFGGVFRAPTLGSIPSVGREALALSRYIKDYYESDGSVRPALPLAGETNFSGWNSYVDNLTYYVQDASFIRLKEVSLDYTIPSSVIRKFRIENAKIFTQIRDIGLIYTANRYGYDPEWLPGQEKPSTTVSLGINLSF